MSRVPECHNSLCAGVANPAPIISTLLLEPSLQDFVRIDGICTVVDTKHVTSHLDRKEATGKENEACAQIAYADRIILNKTDLISISELADLKARMMAINALASMQEAVQSVVPVDYVLGIGGYALDEISSQVCMRIGCEHVRCICTALAWPGNCVSVDNMASQKGYRRRVPFTCVSHFVAAFLERRVLV
jgi:hypothetical protein